MYGKQICKISYGIPYGQSYKGYGICVGDNTFLLENGAVLEADKVHIGRFNFDTSRLRDGRQNIPDFYPGSANGGLTNISISATRNVPANIRAAMEEAADAFIKSKKIYERFEKVRNAYVQAVEEPVAILNGLADKLNKCKGVLNKQEFTEAFKESLSRDVKVAMELATKHGFYGTEGEYEVMLYGNELSIERNVIINKWCTPPYTYLEYDDTRQMCQDAEKHPEYIKTLKKYSYPLPVNAKIEEWLELGDKNTLTYRGEYHIKLDKDKPLTRDYAVQLAREFAGTTKNYEENIEEESFER